MPSSMPFDRKRKVMIRQHMKKQEEDAGGKDRLPKEKITIKGQTDRHPVYKFSIGDLVFNKANGRIKAEVAEKESELGRQLDRFEDIDQKTIKDLLLAIRPDENEKIKEDLRKNGQRESGIITCDGILINGNRRKAILNELYTETKDDRFKYLDVHVLPSDITKAELWLIEAGIQMSAPQQLDYSPINQLLKLREGTRAGLEIDDMASRIYGISREKIEADLQRLELIDEYLCDFLRKEGRYYLVRNVNEHFIDLQNIISWVRRPRGRVRTDWNWDEDDVIELKLVAFYFIRIRLSHMRIRGLRDLFATKTAWRQVKQALNVPPKLTQQECGDLGLATIAELEHDEDFENHEDFEVPITVFEERDLQEEAHWRKKHETKLKSFYEDGKEHEQIIKDSERPLTLAKRALKNIGAIPKKQNKLKEPEMDDILAEIIKKTNALRKIIKIQTTNTRKQRRRAQKQKRS